LPGVALAAAIATAAIAAAPIAAALATAALAAGCLTIRETGECFGDRSRERAEQRQADQYCRL
jgi:hypothetical protein